MKAQLILFTLVSFFAFGSRLDAALDSLVWAAERLSVVKEFDEAKHDGLICSLDEVEEVSADSSFAKIKYLRIRCEKSSIGKFLDALSKFSELRVLVLIESKIESGDPAGILSAAPNLRSLVFIKADATDLSWPDSNNSVEEIWISSESIREIPPSLANDKKIEKLIMPNCGLETLHGDLSGMVSLKMVYFDHCGVRFVNPNFKLPASIEFVQLGFNELTAVPEFIQSLPNLRYIDFMSNKITRIPQWLDDAMDGTALEVNLASNNIRYIPDFVWNHAGRFHLADNEFSEDRHRGSLNKKQAGEN